MIFRTVLVFLVLSFGSAFAAGSDSSGSSSGEETVITLKVYINPLWA